MSLTCKTMSADRHCGIAFLGWERNPAPAADLSLGFIQLSLASVSLSKKPNKPLENKDWYACVGGEGEECAITN